MKINSTKILSLLTIFVLTFSSAYASQNVISSIVISKSKDKPNTYELNIDSTQSSQYKTNIEQDGSVYFDLKNAVLAKNAGPVYDDVTDIENVSVKQLEKNKVRIYVKGKNAKNTDLIFINSLFEPQNQKKIIINRPINEYKSTSYNDDLENQTDIQDWDDNSFNFKHLLTSMILSLKDGIGGIAFIVLALLAIFVTAFKNVADRITKDQEPLINMNSNLADNVLNDISPRSEALKAAQIELTKAHQKYQTYIQNKYGNDTPKQKSVTTDAVKQGIALTQYQKSNKNPYLDQEVLRIQKEFPKNVINTQIPPRPKAPVSNSIPKNPTFKSPYIQRKENRADNILTNNLKNDSNEEKTYKKPNNLKFLESVTKIYEQSGREDLASGLKNSISKAKQSL